MTFYEETDTRLRHGTNNTDGIRLAGADWLTARRPPRCLRGSQIAFSIELQETQITHILLTMMQALIPTLTLLILNLADGAPIKYKYSGYGANAQIYWQEDGCDYGSFVDINAGESVSKVQGNGKPETSKSPSVYTYYEHWYDCSDNSATHTYLYMDYDATPSASVAIKKLDSASVSSTFGAFLVTESCGIECGSYEENGETYTYCYPVCEQVSVEKAEVSLQATFAGTGNAYTSTYRSNNRDPNGFSRYKYSGRSRDATVSVIAFTVDDTPIPIPSNAERFASIYTTNSGELYMYRNGN